MASGIRSIYYVAVICNNQPARVPDLMGYQLLILEAYHEFRNDCWLGYDRRFRQWAASHPRTRWVAIEPTLWSLAFQGQARSSRCKHCFSLSHSSVECELSLEPHPGRSLAREKQDPPPRVPRGQFAINGMTRPHQHAIILTASIIIFVTFVR